MTLVAVVLGAAVWPGGEPSPTLARRAAHAVALYRSGTVQGILGCGATGRHPPAESEVIARLCRAAGVPDAALLYDSCSRTTRENLLNAQAILRAQGARALIVTDPYHAPRARLIARQIGLACTVSCPSWRLIGPRQWARHLLREGVALLATLLRQR